MKSIGYVQAEPVVKLRPYHRERLPFVQYGPSETVPNDSYSIQELFKRYAQGQDLGNLRRPTFYMEDANHDTPDFEKVQAMDFAEREEVVAEVAQRGKVAKSQLDAIKADQDLKAKADAEELNEIKVQHRVAKSGIGNKVKDEKAASKDKRSEE